ncbi:MAG: DUF1593 domain-containing protein [Bacteroidales bacterium]|nr:DUF1593 domain-containing protein [Bacteroidales bacterium]
MKRLLSMAAWAVLCLTLAQCTPKTQPDTRTRVIVTSDGEIDDECSMVRFMLYMNEWDVEGIVTSSSQYHWHGHRWAGDDWMEPYLDAYAQVYPNLIRHDSRYPTPEYVRSITKLGNVETEGEMDQVTAGSELIARVLLDETDDRPVWLQAWGGTNTIARALRTIEETHPEKMDYVAAKARLFCIWEQDSTYQAYIRPVWGKIKTIISDQFVAYDYFWPYYNIPVEDSRYFGAEWMKENILEGHGPLCGAYKALEDGAFRSEGDSPSYFYAIPTGLSDLEHPDWGNWGGRYVNVRENQWLDPVPEADYVYPEGRYYTRSAWGRARLDPLRKADIYDDPLIYEYLQDILRWLPDVQNDFAARADWCVKSFEEANHAPVIDPAAPQTVRAKAGDTVSLAVRASDPDRDALSYDWWYYAAPGSYPGSCEVPDAARATTSVRIPADAASGQTLHFICTVRDGGTPQLTRYKRIVVEIE